MNDGVLAEIAVVGSSKATPSKHHVGVLVSVDFMLTFLNLVVGAPDACTIYIRIRSACSATHRQPTAAGDSLMLRAGPF